MEAELSGVLVQLSREAWNATIRGGDQGSSRKGLAESSSVFLHLVRLGTIARRVRKTKGIRFSLVNKGWSVV
jgi:hypothetical protein